MARLDTTQWFPDLSARLGWTPETPTIHDAIGRHGYFPNAEDPDQAAETWAALGFDAAEVDEWLSARCFDPHAARDLSDAGVSPRLAAVKTSAGTPHFVDTIGYKLSDHQLELAEALTLLGLS